jgi:hypothetical protein
MPTASTSYVFAPSRMTIAFLTSPPSFKSHPRLSEVHIRVCAFLKRRVHRLVTEGT